VFLIAAGWFSVGIEDAGVASVYCDPVSHISAQDEAVYLREAIEMVVSGHWATPTYLGRYALNKPPLMQWLAAASMKMFGISAWAGRLPLLLAAALIVALVFALVWRVHSLAAAAGAALLLASSHLYYVFARLCMTDMLLTLWVVGALFVIMSDPALRRNASVLAFGACVGAGLMTKGAAGLLPLVALGLYWLLAGREMRPPLLRAAGVLATAAAVALPWHLYQAFVHPHWFFAEYVLMQHLSVGVTAPPQYSSENHLVFYARRMCLIDPVITIAAALSLPVAMRRWRKQPAVLAWLAALILALFGFRYRSGYYLLPLIPVLAVLSGILLDALRPRARTLGLALVATCMVIKLVSGSPLWGLPAGIASQLPVARGLQEYCAQHRGNGLIVVGLDDQFYASDLPVARVRYCLLAPGGTPSARPPMDFERLGIVVSVAQFNELSRWLPNFRTELERFDMPSDAAVATVVLANNGREVAALIATHPELDFLIGRSLLRGLDVASPHRIEEAGGDHVFLLAVNSSVSSSGWSCGL
jgi:4-amino-4-deoxy-L-arabinose transferase-like glycosyltransferase